MLRYLITNIQTIQALIFTLHRNKPIPTIEGDLRIVLIA